MQFALLCLAHSVSITSIIDLIWFFFISARMNHMMLYKIFGMSSSICMIRWDSVNDVFSSFLVGWHYRLCNCCPCSDVRWDAIESSRQSTFDVFHNLIAFNFNRIYFYLTILSITLRTNSRNQMLFFSHSVWCVSQRQLSCTSISHRFSVARSNLSVCRLLRI